MFLPSQLVEISQRFQPDVEDLQTLLEEEQLPVGSAECLQELSTRLGSDPRFRRDVSFMVRSMLGREREEPGSMDVLGVLIVAAGGARQEFESPAQQQVVRELLRFVIQQRRPEAAAAITPAVVPVERRPDMQTAIEPRFAARQERPSPAPLVVAPDPVAMPSLLRDELESSSRRAPVGWVVAVLVVLAALGAGLAIRRSGSKAGMQQATLATSPSATSAAYPAASKPERRVIVPRLRKPTHNLGRSSPMLPGETRRHPGRSEASLSMPTAANRRPRIDLRPEPLQPGPELKEPLSSVAVQPVPPHHEPAAVSLPADAARQRSAPGSTDVSNVFAHPEAAAITVANQVPPPAFHSKDPVLIPRNKTAAAAVPEPLGTVHGGSMGSMVSNLMYSPDPEYPAEAIAAGVEGEVTVRAVVGPRGNVIDANVVSGPPLLREAALDAVGRWRYRPYEEDGKPMTVATTAIFDFQIPRKH